MRIKEPVFKAVKDKGATAACKKGLEMTLAEIEAKGKEHVIANFDEIRTTIASYIGVLAESTPRAILAEKLAIVKTAVEQLPVKRAFAVIVWARNVLIANTPELFDQELDSELATEVRAKFVPFFFDEAGGKRLFKYILEANESDIINMGKSFPMPVKIEYYSRLMNLRPQCETFIRKYAECAYYGDLENLFVKVLETPEKAAKKRACCEYYADTVYNEAGKPSTPFQLELACKLLAPYLDNEENKTLYADLAERLSEKTVTRK